MTGEELPRARVRRRRPWLQLIWIVPLIAAGLAAWLVYERLSRYGPEVTIQFRDGGGLRVGQTPVKYRGVQVGVVTGMALSEDREHVIVKARLERSAELLASSGTQFWIVRPQVGWGNVTGLGTVISGPEIQAQAGGGSEPRTHFTGLERAPAPPGLRVVLKGERPVSLRPGSPVYYRGVEVGAVQDVRLSSNATAADVHIVVLQRYAPLVRTGSAFWNVSGISVSGGLLKGIELELESVRSLVTGGIEFASPEKSPPAKAGTVFFLHDSPRKEWLSWNARIAIGKESP
ncbi:MAG TPA: MlaD family protein [Burkholderiales bacterium]|nr:MlaD family protein [Burkholderiales bacterium]